MKVNFNVPIKGLDGKDILTPDQKTVSMGKELGNHLVQAAKGDVLKHYGWATKMYNGEPIDLDKSDKELLTTFIKGHEQMTILLKAQLLEQMEKPEAKSATSKK